MTPFRRRLLAVLTVLSVLLTACGGDDDTGESGSEDTTEDAGGVRDNTGEDTADEGEPQYGGTITVGLEAESNSWLPGESTAANAGLSVMVALHDPLVVRTEEGAIEPYLAQSVEPNEEFTRYSFTLREGVKFHDGTDLTADVIKANFDEYLTVPGATTASTFEGVTLEVTGPMSFDYVLSESDAAFLDKLLTSPGMPFSIEAARAAGDDAGANPVGTGPFVFESWTRDGELKVSRNESYWRTDEAGNQLPYLDGVVFRPIPDEDTRLDSVVSSDIDVMQTLRQSLVRRSREVVDRGGFVSYEWLGNNAGGSIINTLRPPFDDKRVRQALAWGADQEQIIEVLGGTGITPPQTQWFSEDSPWYSEAAAEAYPEYDPDRARELLQDYMDDPERSDGKAVGSTVRFTFDCPPDPSLIEVSQAVQAFWQDIGFEVDLDSKEQSAHIDQALGLGSNPPLSGDYDVQCWRLGSENDPYSQWESAFGPWETEVLNVTNFTHPTITENLEKMRTEGDFEARKALVEEISLILAEELPSTWSGGTAMAIVARDAVKGLMNGATPEGAPIDGAANAIVRTTTVWLDG